MLSFCRALDEQKSSFYACQLQGCDQISELFGTVNMRREEVRFLRFEKVWQVDVHGCSIGRCFDFVENKIALPTFVCSNRAVDELLANIGTHFWCSKRNSKRSLDSALQIERLFVWRRVQGWCGSNWKYIDTETAICGSLLLLDQWDSDRSLVIEEDWWNCRAFFFVLSTDEKKRVVIVFFLARNWQFLRVRKAIRIQYYES